MGQLSPLVMQLAEEAGYSRAYGPFMQRPPRTFTQGAFAVVVVIVFILVIVLAWLLTKPKK